MILRFQPAGKVGWKSGARRNKNMISNSTEQGPKKSGDAQLNRACEACRVSKVRCLVVPNSSSSQCQRCAKAGRNCVFAAPAKRRQRKRTDVRVAELERELKQRE